MPNRFLQFVLESSLRVCENASCAVKSQFVWFSFICFYLFFFVLMQSKRRGLSLEEKREKMLQIFYESQDFFLVGSKFTLQLPFFMLICMNFIFVFVFTLLIYMAFIFVVVGGGVSA